VTWYLSGIKEAVLAKPFLFFSLKVGLAACERCFAEFGLEDIS